MLDLKVSARHSLHICKRKKQLTLITHFHIFAYLFYLAKKGPKTNNLNYLLKNCSARDRQQAKITFISI
jgi:hypothetical protein